MISAVKVMVRWLLTLTALYPTVKVLMATKLRMYIAEKNSDNPSLNIPEDMPLT